MEVEIAGDDELRRGFPRLYLFGDKTSSLRSPENMEYG